MEKSMRDALVDAGPSGQDSTVGDAPAARRLSLLEKPGLMLVAQFALIVGILGVWELLSKYKILDAFFFSRPTAIFAAAVTAVQSKAFVLHLSATLAEAGT